jgi:hypothetical protein
MRCWCSSENEQLRHFHLAIIIQSCNSIHGWISLYTFRRRKRQCQISCCNRSPCEALSNKQFPDCIKSMTNWIQNLIMSFETRWSDIVDKSLAGVQVPTVIAYCSLTTVECVLDNWKQLTDDQLDKRVSFIDACNTWII